MYFDKAGKEHTDATLKLAIDGAKQRKLTHLVVASTHGNTAMAALPLLQGSGLKMVVVTHNVGFAKPNESGFESEARMAIEAAGHTIHTGTLVTRNMNKAFSSKFGGYSQTEIVNATLRMFGQGMKVCPEIAAMAADSGLVPFGDVVCVAGTGHGADTAVVLQATSSNNFLDIKIREILCKPKDF
jgi:hypothetical protein